MPIADRFNFELIGLEAGILRATAVPHAGHENPLGVVQGGFASTVLDMAMGLVSITVLEPEAAGVATVDLSVRFIRPIYASSGLMTVEASILHAGRLLIVSQAHLSDAAGKLYATAQSSSLIRYSVSS